MESTINHHHGMGQRSWQMIVKTNDAKFVVMTSSKDVVGSACPAVVVDTMDIKTIVVNSLCSKDLV
jgi:hypothetical protein